MDVMSAELDRFKTRLDQSNAMSYTQAINFGNDDIQQASVDWEKKIEEYHNAMMRNERNNGREDVFGAIREVVSGRVYFDSIEDIIQQVKIKLKGK